MVGGQSSHRVNGGGLAPWQAALASRLLLHDLCAGVPAGELASQCGLSRSHFTRAFKVSMGTPPHRWLVWQRIHRAAELLEGTEEGISVIAVSCGFSDQSHLTRVFHATVGESPAAWRRQRKAGLAAALGPGAAPSARGVAEA